MKLVIKPLSPETAGDYLGFFDHRAFSDGSPYYPCYCCAFQMTKAQLQAEFFQKARSNGGGTENLRLAMREYAGKMIAGGLLQGYLAYEGEAAVGWCNANDQARYVRTGEFDLDEVPEDEPPPGSGDTRIKSIVCFAIAPDFRGKGIASALLRRVCEDADRAGYDAVESYPVSREQNGPLDFTGPVGLYEKAGFLPVDRRGDTLVMRKKLK